MTSAVLDTNSVSPSVDNPDATPPDVDELLRMMEEELDFGTSKDSARGDTGSHGVSYPDEAISTARSGGTMPFADAEVQVQCALEAKAVATLLGDMDIFTLACERYPALVRDVMQLRRHF